MYFPISGYPEYFDTFVTEVPLIFEQFMGPIYVKNNNTIQHPVTTVCGQHVIFYILQRCRDKTMGQILKCYSTEKLLLNDIMVNKIVNMNFQSNLQIMNTDFLETLP